MLFQNLTSHGFIIKAVLIYFINFCNINELVNGEYNSSIETVADNADERKKLLEQLLQKSDALDEKLTRI